MSSKLKVPINDKKLAEHAFDGLLPEYRKSMVDQPIYTKNYIIRYGRIYEKERDHDARYRPTPNTPGMYLPSHLLHDEKKKSRITEAT